jgi:hypothetical protein
MHLDERQAHQLRSCFGQLISKPISRKVDWSYLSINPLPQQSCARVVLDWWPEWLDAVHHWDEDGL